MVNFKQGLIKKILIILLTLLIPVGGLIFLSRDINNRAEAIKNNARSLLIVPKNCHYSRSCKVSLRKLILIRVF